jgi:hypothetical protein
VCQFICLTRYDLHRHISGKPATSEIVLSIASEVPERVIDVVEEQNLRSGSRNFPPCPAG